MKENYSNSGKKVDVVESPVVKEPSGKPRRSSSSKSRSRRRRGKKKSRVASKAVKLLGASKSFVAAANKRDKSGKLLRLSNSGSSRRALLGSLRGILGRATWRTCNLSLQPGILSFEDLRLDGSHATSDHISLTEINSIEMNTVPAEPCEYVVLLSLYIITHTPTLSNTTGTTRSNSRCGKVIRTHFDRTIERISDVGNKPL